MYIKGKAGGQKQAAQGANRVLGLVKR